MRDPFWRSPSGDVELHAGDCREVLAAMPENRFTACVCDPPYDLTGKSGTGGFMGKKWDGTGVAFDPATWRAVMRTMKPGAFLLAFGGTRTWHRLACAIEDAGFEIRDSVGCFMPLVWACGSGFPKSMNLGKAIDKVRDDVEPRRAVCRWLKCRMIEAQKTSRDIAVEFGFHPRMVDHWAALDSDSQPSLPTLEQWDRLRVMLGFNDSMDAEVLRLNLRKGEPGEAWNGRLVTGQVEEWKNRINFAMTSRDGLRRDIPASALSAAWSGHGTALKPAFEPCIVAMKPLDGTFAANALAHGVAGLNIDGCRIAATGGSPAEARRAIARRTGNAPVSDRPAAEAEAEGKVENRSSPDVYMAERPGEKLGRWPANLILSHSESCVRVGTKKVKGSNFNGHPEGRKQAVFGSDDRPRQASGYADADGLEEVESWICQPACPVHILDEQSGESASVQREGKRAGKCDGRLGAFKGQDAAVMGHTDFGGASRFFFCAKADATERRGSKHPTVKPLDLMRWLVRMVTYPGTGNLILDPFAGSCTTLEACRLEYVRSVGIDLHADHLEDGRKRLTQESLFAPKQEE